MNPTDPLSDTERLTIALQENTRQIEDLTLAVVALTQQLWPRTTYGLTFPPESDHRPIEDRKPLPTIQRDET